MNYLKECWNWVHLFGITVLFLLLLKFTMYFIVAIPITFGLGLLWELCDMFIRRFPFDSNGFDIRDIGMNTIGIMLGVLLCM